MEIKYICKLLLVALSVLVIACNDGFLEKLPGDKLVNETFWNTDNDFRSYALGLYDFKGYGVGNDKSVFYNNSDETCKSAMEQDSRIFNRRVIPETGGGWSWSRLRTINIMIREARKSSLPSADKLHWEGVARYFRANEYFSKVKSFGDVPWIGKELTTSSEELYKGQDSRALVMDSVLADLNFAVKYIREKDKENQINRDVALASKSEICLFEGTFRKYHSELKLTDWRKWLEECIAASEKLMGGKYILSKNYRDIYASLDLSSNSEVILYKQYETGVIANNRTMLISLTAQSYGLLAGTKDAVESYLCSDGLPYGVSPLHPKAVSGEPELLEEEFLDRDPRLSLTFVVPFRDNSPTQLPAIDEAYSGNIPPFMPAFSGEGYILSISGYHPYKWWNPESPNTDATVGVTDAPIYSLNEILLNYAEAKAELGSCTNEELDKSINLLRKRARMPVLTIDKVNVMNDPKHEKYAPEISALLWEIRRERQVELMLDGTRLSDIIRWKKASYFSKPFIGAYIDLTQRPKEAYNSNDTWKAKVVLGDRDGNVLEGVTKGYVLPYGKEKQPQYNDDELKLYYDPIAKEHLTLNPNLHQSPGWDKE